MHTPGLTKNFVADGDLEKYSFAAAGEDDGTAAQAAGATAPILGVTTIVGAADGERVDVILDGIAYVTAGGTIAYGAQVTANSAGKAVTASTGHSAGIALEAATADDVIPVLITRGFVAAE